MFGHIEEVIGEANKIAVTGHVRPDGDCVGSSLGLYHYLKEVFPELDVQVYLDPVHPHFSMLRGVDVLKHEVTEQDEPDLLFVLDCSEKGRIGTGAELVDRAKRIVCVDHHLGNSGFGDETHIVPDASSTAEVLFHLMDPQRITEECAACLYTGIVHDTGVFRHSCTKRSTMEAAGLLMEKGAPFTRIILETFYQKSLQENRIMGAVLAESALYLNGKVAFGFADRKQMERYQVTPKNLDGIVDHLNQTEGICAAIFLYETEPGIFKVSLRSGEMVNVNAVASRFGGGGHMRASGCTMEGTPEEIRDKLLCEMEKQLG